MKPTLVFLKNEFSIIQEVFSKWLKDRALTLGAALSYYTVFSLGPLLVVVIALAGLVFGGEAARGELSTQIQNLLGAKSAEAIQNLLASNKSESTNILASIFGVTILIAGATGVFIELQSTLNIVWEVKDSVSSGFKGFLKDRLLSLAMVASIGFLLLVALVINAVIAAAGKYTQSFLPFTPLITHVINFVVSFSIVTALFALIFKYLPDAEVKWRNVWSGALFTALLFTLGKFAIGMYVGKSGVTSAFGASSSIVLIMLWAYYSSLILIFGAEYTVIISRRNAPRV